MSHGDHIQPEISRVILFRRTLEWTYLFLWVSIRGLYSSITADLRPVIHTEKHFISCQTVLLAHTLLSVHLKAREVGQSGIIRLNSRGKPKKQKAATARNSK